MTKTNISNYEVITSFAAGQNFIGRGEQSWFPMQRNYSSSVSLLGKGGES